MAVRRLRQMRLAFGLTRAEPVAQAPFLGLNLDRALVRELEAAARSTALQFTAPAAQTQHRAQARVQERGLAQAVRETSVQAAVQAVHGCPVRASAQGEAVLGQVRAAARDLKLVPVQVVEQGRVADRAPPVVRDAVVDLVQATLRARETQEERAHAVGIRREL
ncbi:MAG: hypothetical protein WA657_13800 [Candidatus Acidiferrales bacterium]